MSNEFESPTCGCCTEMQMMAAGTAPNKESIPKSADVNGDGVVDETDLAALDAIILGSGTSAQESSAAAPEPTLAEPE